MKQDNRITLGSIPDNYSEVINSTYRSFRSSITGFYYYDTVRDGVYKILESEHVFTDLDYSFGYRWPELRHKILKTKRMNKQFYDKYMTCPQSNFDKIRA